MEMEQGILQRIQGQLDGMGLPRSLHRVACQKILGQVFDAGATFQFQESSGEVEDSDEDGADTTTVEQSNGIDAEKTFEPFQFIKRKYDLATIGDMKAYSDVFLIDHMWTTTFPQSRQQLRDIPGLLSRVASLFAVSDEEEALIHDAEKQDLAVDAVWQKMWPLMNSYNVDGPDGYTTWYLMDEVGAAICHDREANCCVHPLYVNLDGLDGRSTSNTGGFGLSLLWPIKDIDEGDLISRDYLPLSYKIVADSLGDQSDVLGLPFPERVEALRKDARFQEVANLEIMRELKNVGFLNVPLASERSRYLQQIKQTALLVRETLESPNAINSAATEQHCELLTERPLNWEHVTDRLNAAAAVDGSAQKKLRIFCDRDDYLSAGCLRQLSTKFEFVNDSNEADVLYLIDHVIDVHTDTEHVKKDKMLTQFWWEGMIVTKNHFLRTMKAAHKKFKRMQADDNATTSTAVDIVGYEGEGWAWIAAAYDLSKPADFAAFLEHYVSVDEATGSDNNLWLLKKHVGRQGIDYPLTSSVSCAVRHTDLWPRIACKYIHSPCLFHGCKFDLRYYVVVLSMNPLRLMRHRIFIPRASNIPYSLDDLECYQKHFTVMGFLEEPSLLQGIRGSGVRSDPLMCEFIQQFDGEQQSESGSESKLKWGQHIQPEIDRVLRSVFQCVALVAEDEPPHPSGQALHPNAGWSLAQPNACPARAMFGVDIMLDCGNSNIIRDGIRIPQPTVLEVQFAPDCYRTHQTYPEFWDLTLSALFLSGSEGMVNI